MCYSDYPPDSPREHRRTVPATGDTIMGESPPSPQKKTLLKAKNLGENVITAKLTMDYVKAT